MFGRPDPPRVALFPGHGEEGDDNDHEDAGDKKEACTQFPRVLQLLAMETFSFRALFSFFTL